jgi:hypothetical protein
MRNFGIHCLCWLAFATTRMFRDAQLDLSAAGLGEMLSFVGPTVLIFYGVAWGIAPLLAQKRHWAFVGLAAGAIVLYAWLRGEAMFWLAPQWGAKGAKMHWFVNNLWNGFIFTITACGYYLTQKYYREELKRQGLQQELLQAELAFLKSQTNPHFLYNSLNFLYSQAISVSEPLSKSILLLSDILRYAIEEADPQGLVVLDKEIKHLENFIEMHRLRFQHKLQVDYECTVPGAERAQIKILPFLLITLVENAFKHGLVNKKPLYIRLALSDAHLLFSVKNQIDRQAEKHLTPGVGLKNIRRMLDLAYPQAHNLNLEERGEDFIAELRLKIH